MHFFAPQSKKFFKAWPTLGANLLATQDETLR